MGFTVSESIIKIIIAQLSWKGKDQVQVLMRNAGIDADNTDIILAVLPRFGSSHTKKS